MMALAEVDAAALDGELREEEDDGGFAEAQNGGGGGSSSSSGGRAAASRLSEAEAATLLAQIPETKTFYPSEAEFADALGYLRKIAPEAQAFGVVRIVPPSSWRPRSIFPFTSHIRLPVKLQSCLGSGERRRAGAAAIITSTLRPKIHFARLKQLNEQKARMWTAGVDRQRDWEAMVAAYHRWLRSTAPQTWYCSDVEASAFAEGPDADASDWNVRHLRRSPLNLLHATVTDVPGVNSPMLYVGMLFSTFCWHTEDNWLYSISYNHAGSDPKTWWGVPAHAAPRLEQLVREVLFPEHESSAKLLALKSTFFSPAWLVRHGVPVFRALQRAGDIMITLPRAYHAGFSHGLSCAESANIAPLDWLPWGKACSLLYRAIRQVSVLSVEEIVLRNARALVAEAANAAAGGGRELQAPHALAEALLARTPQQHREALRVRCQTLLHELLQLHDSVLFLSNAVKQQAPAVARVQGDPRASALFCSLCRFPCYAFCVRCPCTSEVALCGHCALRVLARRRQLCKTCGAVMAVLRTSPRELEHVEDVLAALARALAAPTRDARAAGH
jgi:hypothetical protein